MAGTIPRRRLEHGCASWTLPRRRCGRPVRQRPSDRGGRSGSHHADGRCPARLAAARSRRQSR